MRHALLTGYTRRTWGHVTRLLAIAERLVGRRVRVTFACAPDARSMIEHAGYATIELRAIERQDLLQSTGDPTRRIRWYGRELAAARACIRAVAPDVVVTDLSPLVNVAAALEEVTSTSVLNLELFQSPLPWWLTSLDTVLAALELPRWARARVFGDTLIVADAPDAMGLRDLAPGMAQAVMASVRDVRFVGPVLRDHARWSRSRRRRPHVVVSFGYLYAEGLTAQLLPAFADLDADLLVITSKPPSAVLRAIAADVVRRGRARVRFERYLPDFGRRLAEVDALVTHGGHATLIQALSVGVPTLVVPVTLEQELNARRLRGLGEVVPPTSEAALQAAGTQLALLLRDRSRDGARRRAARALARLDGASAAARAIAELATTPRLHCPPA